MSDRKSDMADGSSPAGGPLDPMTATAATRGSAIAQASTVRELSGDRVASQEGWRIIVNAIPDPAIAINDHGFITHHNARAIEVFPSTRLGALVSSISRFPALDSAVLTALDGHPDPQTVQISERVPVPRHISATVTPLAKPASGEGFPAVLLVFRDLTEQERLNKMRADFVTNASHELRTPLSSLRGYIETLQGAAQHDPKNRARFLSIMLDQAVRMSRLIDDLLSLSRMEMRVHLPPTGVVDLNDVATAVAQTVDPLARQSDAVLTVHRLNRPARIRGDREEIVQALLNLVQNALKYGGSGVTIDVIVKEDVRGEGLPSGVAVCVKDDGPGIAPKHVPRLTERFYRAPETASEVGGTGLGLAIVKQIVLRHRGDLEIASTPPRGATFELRFDELRRLDDEELGKIKKNVVNQSVNPS